MSDLRYLAAIPWEPEVFIAAEFERRVQVRSARRSEPLAVVDTVFDFGGRRAGLVPGRAADQDPVLVAGAWSRHGVCGYDLQGQLLWQHQCPTNVQVVTALAGGRVAVTYEHAATRLLDAATGTQLGTLRGVREVVPLRASLSLAVGSTWFGLLDADLQPCGPRIPMTGYAVLSAAAAAADPAGPAVDRQRWAVAVADEGLFLYDEDGRRAKLHTSAGHVVHVAHDPLTDTWVALTLDHWGATALLRLDEDAQVLQRVVQAPGERIWQVATLAGGAALVVLTSALQVVDCATLTVRTLSATETPRA